METVTQQGREARMNHLERKSILALQKKVKKNRNLSALLDSKTGSGDNIPGGYNDPFDYPSNEN